MSKPKYALCNLDSCVAVVWETFARDICDGWDSIGNEIDGQDIRDIIKENN